MQTFVDDPAVIGVVGPYNSAVAKVQIPIGNDAGLLQCSPANTNQDLTKGDRRPGPARKKPDKIAYIRVATTDDIQGPAVAQYASTRSGSRTSRSSTTPRPSARASRTRSRPSGRSSAGPSSIARARPKGTTDFNAILTKVKDAAPTACTTAA